MTAIEPETAEFAGAQPAGSRRTAPLPPGQVAIDHFPRFGTHLSRPAPPVPADPAIEVTGVLTNPVTVPVRDLVTMARRDLDADFHCVSGWTATGLRWRGVPFATFYRSVVEPILAPGVKVTHIVFTGLDGHESALLVEDALNENVLLADQLNGEALDSDHGAPVRLLSPQQYGYMSTKHLSRIEVRTSPPRRLGAAHPIAALGLRGPLVMRHPRARVKEEERHPFLPAQLLRPLYHRIAKRGTRLSTDRARLRLPDEEHYSQPWRIHEITHDFRLEDVWELPGHMDPDDFPAFVRRVADFDLADSGSAAVRVLVAARLKLGALLNLDRADAGVGGRVSSLRDRLGEDLRGRPGPGLSALPGSPVFVTENESAIEIANATVHGVLHLGCVPQSDGRSSVRLAVLVKPNGPVGEAYLALIRPLRHLVVYPSLIPALGARMPQRP